LGSGRDLRAGHITERTFNAGDKLVAARVERRRMQYLYGDGERYTFMNLETFDQMEIPARIVEEALPYLKESDEVQLVLHGDEVLGVELPAAVELKIVSSEPGAVYQACVICHGSGRSRDAIAGFVSGT